MATALAIVIGSVLTLVLTTAPSTSSSATTSGGGNTIAIVDFDYDPPELQATAGTEIAIENADAARHTITADDDSFDSGVIEGGASGTVTIDQPGTYGYFCEFHVFMKGTVEVK